MLNGDPKGKEELARGGGVGVKVSARSQLMCECPEVRDTLGAHQECTSQVKSAMRVRETGWGRWAGQRVEGSAGPVNILDFISSNKHGKVLNKIVI